MDRWVKYICLVVVGISLFLSSWYVIHGDIYFFNDVARDFHLFREIDEKKVVLLGPRSSTSGLFHGPLWMYVNYPAYVIGNGNPVIVGWYWILLIYLFLATSLIIAKKLFGETTGYLYIALLSVHLVFAANGLFNPYGAFFLLPAFYFFFIKYLQTKNYLFLLSHLFIAGCIIQFEMATGIPLLLLSSLILFYFIFKKKLFLHLICFGILAVPLSTFILFDIRHDFLQFKAVLSYLTASPAKDSSTGTAYLLERLKLLISPGIQVYHNDMTGMRNTLALLIGGIAFFFAWKDPKRRLLYGSLLYFIIGNYLFMLVNRSGQILFHYYMPLSSLTILLFSSFATIKKYKELFLIFFLIVLTLNLQDAILYVKSSDTFIGKNEDSWKFLDLLGTKLFENNDTSFGYFVYSPDIVAYEQRYAVLYRQKFIDKEVFSFEKRPITYLVIAPPPPHNPNMKDEWWKKNQLHLWKKPTDVYSFPNGYKIERYQLTPEEVTTPFDPGINPGLHFR